MCINTSINSNGLLEISICRQIFPYTTQFTFEPQPALSYLNVVVVITSLVLLKCQHTKCKKKTRTLFLLCKQQGNITSKSALWGWVLSAEVSTTIYFFLQTVLFPWNNLKSNLPFSQLCNMFPFKCCSFAVWLACFVQQNSLPSGGKKLANRKEALTPTTCLCTTSGAAYLHAFQLWLISNWQNYSTTCYIMWCFWRGFVVVGLFCFSFVFPQPADI